MTAFDSPPQIAAQETAIDTLARTIWGEARADSVRGKEAVAAVVMNRVKRARSQFGFDWWGGTVVEACLGPDQFDCWRRSPEARRDLMNVRPDDPVFAVCRRIACRAVRGALVDPTSGAVRYHRAHEMPWWAHGLEPTVVIGRRLFYRDHHATPNEDETVQDILDPEVPA
ncbi:MAG: cell wall hydrolase [Alphaproteobacteria bacterium]|nr:cell wall hydrolase [Alphaproteobacteria bacterium]